MRAHRYFPTWATVIWILGVCLGCWAGQPDALGQTQGPGMASDPGPTTTVLLVRHAEKKEIPADNPALTEEGEARARELCRVAGWAGVEVIYATRTKRAMGTAQPLADCLKLQITPYDNAKEVAREILAKHRGKVLLIVSHGGWLETTIQFLAGEAVTPIGEAYDNLFVVTVSAPEKGRALRLKYGKSNETAPCAPR